jgi:glutamate N-acetyltransferase / amino-acid N-acetyltransferase
MTTPRLPLGFRAAGVAAQIKKTGLPDLALIVSETNCASAALFTTNRVKAAPVLRDMALMQSHTHDLRAVIINAGCANACTGEIGLQNADATAQRVAQTLSAAGDVVLADQVFVMSTGVIGVQLPMPKLMAGIPLAAQSLSASGLDAASRAIMTTDTLPKVACATGEINGITFTVTGIAKGSGMIHPNMATMLSVVMTDARVHPADLQRALRHAADQSFHRISVDGDTSTNDTLLILANGASGAHCDHYPQLELFEQALTAVCIDMARQMARDGEGATKLITLRISGATDVHMAEAVGRMIARSPLVKTAFYGEDANWGRIIAAAGYSGEEVDPQRMSLWFGSVLVFQHGMPTQYSEVDATNAIKPHDVDVRLDLGLGNAEATIWTCDLSHDYVTINGKYRT